MVVETVALFVCLWARPRAPCYPPIRGGELGMCCRRTHPERRPEFAEGYLVTGAKHPIEGRVAVHRGAFLPALGAYER